MRSELKIVEIEKESKVWEIKNSYEFVKKEWDGLWLECDKILKRCEELEMIVKEQNWEIMKNEQSISNLN